MVDRVVVAALSLAVVLGVPRLAAGATPKTLVYTGALNDERGEPVGGVYWLRFALHRTRSDRKMLWSEEFYVAVDRGGYQVELGKERPIPQATDLTDLFLSVSVDGVEVQRVRVERTMVSGGGEPEGSVERGPGAAGGECGECRKAEQAEDSERLGGMTFQQLAEVVAKKKVGVGTGVHYTSAAGGDGGVSFRLACPPGFVVTGLKGKAGDTLNNIQLVCSPLEAE